MGRPSPFGRCGDTGRAAHLATINNLLIHCSCLPHASDNHQCVRRCALSRTRTRPTDRREGRGGRCAERVACGVRRVAC
eukprot:2003095-Alexandrium_andersonii.AAC.1